MVTDQTFSNSWVSATRNGNYNQATCPPSAHHHNFRYAVQVPANHKPVRATTPERDRPASQRNASQIMLTARRLLAEAHQAMFTESGQLGRDATAMDMVLDHRLLISVAGVPADGRHRSLAPRNCAPRCQADIDAYWAQQEERRRFSSPIMSKNIEPPVSAERSTAAWLPNVDGDEVWDSAS